MSARIGYTPTQASRIKNAIERDMLTIEDRVGKMGRRVTDHGYGGFFGAEQLEELREKARELKDIVDRRTTA